MSEPAPEPAPEIAEYASRTVDHVRRALGVDLTYDSETLPLLDHYLSTVPADQPSTVELVTATAGAYFGEVARRRLGGRWAGLGGAPAGWRVVLPTGLEFSPVGFAAAAIARRDLDDLDSALDAPPRMRDHLAEALARMTQVTGDEYFSLCGRLDTLEHLHEVLVGVAARLLGEAAEPGGAADDDPGDDDAPAPAGAAPN